MLLVVGLASCSRCHSDHPKPQNHVVSEPPRPTGPQSITVDDYEHEVYKEGPQASFQPTTAAEREMIQKLIPKLLEGSRSEPPADPTPWRAEAQAAGFDIVGWNLYGETFCALPENPGTGHG